MTNYEKYFGSPEKASKTRVLYWGEPERIAVEYKGRTVISGLSKRGYSAWLKKGASDA